MTILPSHPLIFGRYRIVFFVNRFYDTEELAQLIETEEFWTADIFITPPADGLNSEEDSDGDDALATDVNHLSGCQLAAEASARILKADGTVYVGDELEEDIHDQEWDGEDEIPLAQLREASRKVVKLDWENRDLNPQFPEFIPLIVNTEEIFTLYVKK